MIEELKITDWDASITADKQRALVQQLESGLVIFLPRLSFGTLPNEAICFSEKIVHPKLKHVTYHSATKQLQGLISTEAITPLTQMMARYATYSSRLLAYLLPAYQPDLLLRRTSFRPVEIRGRKVPSYRKDDTRLHVDAFPATPTRGKRILRVFSHINPSQESRIWRLGAPFSDVVKYFRSKLTPPLLGSALLLSCLRITKEKRTPYDHYMLKLHNRMKADLDYQKNVPQMLFEFPAGSTWIAFTDQVSHAAMAGKFTLEQTFYLPQEALLDSQKSPCTILENYLGTCLK